MKIYNINDIKALGYETAITVGMFDGVHVGHRQMVEHLAAMARQRNLEPVVVTFRNHPRHVLHPGEEMSLLTTFEERMEKLERCGVANVVALEFDKDTARLSACEFASQILAGQLGMKFLLLGYDNKFGSRDNDDFSQLPKLGQSLGFEIERDHPVMVDGIEVSSTKIRKALLSGNMEQASRMLGEPYSLKGEVAHGRHVGSGIGFPTANLNVATSGKLQPADGVYAMKATVRGNSYDAMGNLGGQPTYGLREKTLEVHLIGFEGFIYGEQLQVQFVKRLRDIRQFQNQEELIAQLRKDKEEVTQIMHT